MKPILKRNICKPSNMWIILCQKLKHCYIKMNHKNYQLIATSYEEYRQKVFLYFFHRMGGSKEEAEDLTQDVFLRLVEFGSLICEATIKSFIFTIAHNLLISYFRRLQKAKEISSYMYDYAERTTTHMEQSLVVSDLEEQERLRVACLPKQRRLVYMMSRYEGMHLEEISLTLGLSQRTVENHLFIGRQEVRQYMRACV